MSKYEENYARAFDRLTKEELTELLRPMDYESDKTKSQPSDSVPHLFDCFISALFGFGLGVATCGLGAWWLL